MMSVQHIHQSNLIEDIDSVDEDAQSLEAWAHMTQVKKLTYDNVMELHRLITLNQLPAKEAGHTRKVDVMVGGRLCPKPYLADQMLRNWILDMAGWKQLDPKEMHVRFELIHPFVDGNGRTGRMLMWWHERQLEHEPTLIMYGERNRYYKWFK